MKEDIDKDYTGDYKVSISDKGRVNFSLNYKWAVGIALTIIGILGYFVIEKYHIIPLEKLKSANIKLIEKDVDTDNVLKVLVQNQKILLDRSSRVELWMVNNILNDHSTDGIDEELIIPNSELRPGAEDTGPGTDSGESIH